MQHSFIFSLALLGLVSLSTPSWGSQPVTRNEVTKSKIVEEGGTGPYKAVMQEVQSLEAHTLFLPSDLSSFGSANPLPLLVWGNGACTNSPWEHFKFLNEIASHGYLVIATGFFPEEEEPYRGPMSTPEQQTQSINWAIAQNRDPHSPLYQKVDEHAICASGMSCGGLQTLYNCADTRITLLMICNSGLFIDPSIAMPNMPMPGKDQLLRIHTPVLYMLGGESDIAYANGMDDFHRINHVPAIAINYPVGHGGTYRQPHGGEFSIPAIAWLDWQLKGKPEARQMLLGQPCGLQQREGWTVETNQLFQQLSDQPAAYIQQSPNGRFTSTAHDGKLSISYFGQGDILTIDANIISAISSGYGTENYDMVMGKRSHCSNRYTEWKYLLSDGRTIALRLYDDGVAWRQSGASTIGVASARKGWLMKWSDAYEGFFECNPVQQVGDRWGYPALFEMSDTCYMLLSESNMTRESAASSLYSTESNAVFEIRPDGEEDGGWQVAIVGSLSDVVESTLITDVAAPCKLDDTSWIHPGVASWVYWAYNHGSNDYDIIKQYTDMAATLHLPYVLIDAEWDEMKNGKTMEDAVRYAVSKGVKPLIWYSSSIGWIDGAPGPKFRLNKPEDREREFAYIAGLGVVGVKIDFFSGDTNQNMAFMIDLLESAARHHLCVNFHGATIPRGWQRTYPNLLSTEAVYGAEWYNNRPTLTKRAAAHNATLPFTRNVIGSMDYTPCAFTDSQHPHITTYAHELALTALFESGIQHLADRPESFLAQPDEVKDYLGTLPTAWDESLLLAGYPAQSVVMARRKGTTWYICGINGTDKKQNLTFSIARLQNLGTDITFFADGKPWKITHPSSVPTSVSCLPRGGFIIVIK